MSSEEMAKEKRINNLAKELCNAPHCHIKDEPTECYHRCKAYIYAKRAAEADYRKASEVAREFIEAVDSMMECISAMTGLELTYFGKYADLKKKYESEKDNGN